MKPLYLYINNFTCHEASEINFNFSSALVVGNLDKNDRFSNGAGKTSIFKAIEYVLFNQVRDPLQEKDILLEDLILEGTDKCRVVFDFQSEDNIYRIVRCRTTKNIADLSLFKRSTVVDDRNPHTPETNKDLWIDISSRRAQDTEADIAKILKTHHKAFVNTYYFMQFDFRSGLAAATPSTRKAILREALDLLVYAKLEKIAKVNADNILKEIDKKQTILSTIGNPTADITELKCKVDIVGGELIDATAAQTEAKQNLDAVNKEREESNLKLSVLQNQHSSILVKKASLSKEKEKLETTIAEYDGKRRRIAEQAQNLIAEIKKLKLSKEELSKIDFSQLEEKKRALGEYGIQRARIETERKSLEKDLEELSIPMPADGTCKHCRQPLSEEHRQACQADIDQKIRTTKDEIRALRQRDAEIVVAAKDLNLQIVGLEKQKNSFDTITTRLAEYEKDFSEKKSLNNEYSSLLNQFKIDLNDKTETLNQLSIEMNNSSMEELKEIEKKLVANMAAVGRADRIYKESSAKVNELNKQKAVLEHSIKDKEALIVQKGEIEKQILELEDQYNLYPSVIQAFGSTGIPSLIIQNILEDLQAEANALLTQLRPGLQLAFKIEKTKDDGTNADTLDIEYFLNNKPRRYSMLSGGQKVCVMFALKMGLSFILQKMMGSQISLLLLDEIDQPFDDNGVEAFADIIKFFQKDFTILVITHRNRLKEYFKNIILVEQGQNMISNARVISR